MKWPTRILDLHTHLFNARYVPLANVIANAMGKEESKLADYVARLLYRLTGSSYKEPAFLKEQRFLLQASPNAYYLDKLWAITQHELLQTTQSLQGVRHGLDAIGARPKSGLPRLLDSELMEIITALSQIDYAQEGWQGSLPAGVPMSVSRAGFEGAQSVADVFRWAESVVRKALHVVTQLMDPNAWGEAENYLEFFLTMLNSEERMVEAIFDGYGPNLPPLQISHLMMDMAPAYTKPKPPYYPFHPTQVGRMESLQRANPGRLHGFSAFDPRRPEWEKYADDARRTGFLGFKFYPAMGFKPFGDEDPVVAQRIADFFDYCVKNHTPVFTHCTPAGFQTIRKQGWNAHPKHWQKVLETPKWKDLRLCLGHAGGGEMSNGPNKSYGWMARTDAQWDDPDNFARIVAHLCRSYPNVYCEMGYITQIFGHGNADAFVSNLEKARKLPGSFDLMDKVAYGSDWHMPDMVDNTRKYLGVFLDIFNRPEYVAFLDKFFWRNGYDYLQLPE